MPENGAYQAQRDKIATGDILLFSGKGQLSETIKWWTRSDYSHVGMAVVLREQNLVACWESTTLSNVPDIEGSMVRGVQLVPLSIRLARYRGEVFVRHLTKPLADEQHAALWALRRRLTGRPYEKSKIELLRTLLPDRWNRGEDLASLFCSELVAETYQGLGLLADMDDGGRPSDSYTPKDFSTRARLELLDGFELGQEVRLR